MNFLVPLLPMDSTNRSVLQFVSAASQALETQDGDVLSREKDDTDDITPSLKRETESPEHIRKLLAEAAGNTLDTESSSHSLQADIEEKPLDAKEHSTEEKVRIIFQLTDDENLLGEWPCYIVRSAIVPGFLYLTTNHVCFYAPLPRNQQGYQKTGYLLVKTNGFQRCYFDLKKDVISWYESATDMYSPLGKIDLKEALEVRQSKRREHGFRITTMNKTWHFKADTKAAMIEWLNILQRTTFLAKNSGTSLKLSFPFEKILDIEQTNAFEFQQFLKLRVVGIEDGFVVDECYFAYFTDIDTTFNQLKDVWQSHPSSQESHPASSSTPSANESPIISPSLSFADLYDADSKPIIIQTLSAKQQQTTDPQGKTSGQAVSSSITGTLKDLIYPPSASEEQTETGIGLVSQGDTGGEIDSSSSDDEEQPVVGWLDEKRRSGMKLVYGLLKGRTGTSATVYHGNNDDEEDGDSCISQQQWFTAPPHGIQIDNRTLTNFRKYFVLPESEKLFAVYPCSLMKTLPCYGKLYISSNYISFNSKGFATKAKMIIPFSDVLRIQKLRSRGYIFHSLSILTQKKKEIFLDFSSLSRRNSCFARLYLQHKWVTEEQSMPEQVNEDMKHWETMLLQNEHEETSGHVAPPLETARPILTDGPFEELLYKKPERPLHFTCVTIGTRGDVQPYIALCKGLMKDGHKCRIATHDEFKDWIEEHHIEFRSIGGDPGELMRICVENNFFSVNFVVEGLRLFKTWIDELLVLAWEACQGTDVLIESPSAMVGIHMAEKLGIPYFRSFPMPMTRTRSFPHPFATPNSPKGRLYNDMTYVLFDHAVWRAIASQTNRFRKNTLELPSTTYEKLEVWKIPYLYSFSPSIVPSPLDWLDWIHCTGYWFLDNPQTGWQPNEELTGFLDSNDERPIVYIGFGSIIVSDPIEILRIIVDAVLLSNVRAIVSEGWSSRLAGKEAIKGQAATKSRLSEKYPGTILDVSSVPHDWLFPKVRAVVHHGGAGTTAAGLRAGRPTIVKPFFADQFFWGERVEEMGVGRCVKNLTAETLAAALRIVSTDDNMMKTASLVGEKIRAENGVDTAIQCIYRDMVLAEARTVSSAQRTKSDETDAMTSSFLDEDQEWTLIDSTTSGSISPDTWRPLTS